MLKWSKEKLVFAHDLFKLEDQVANILSFFVGAILAFGGIPDLSVNLLYGLVAVAGALLGINLFNQITDIEIDRINKPHRPLPNGKVSTQTALNIVIFLFLVSLLSAYIFSIVLFGLTLAYLILGTAYSLKPFRLKERFLLSNFSIAIWYNFLNFLMGWVVFRPLLDAPFALLTLWFIYDFIAINSKDYFDINGDGQFGVKTLPVLFGVDKALKIDYFSQVLTQLVFAVLVFTGFLPFYILAFNVVTLAVTSWLFLHVCKTHNFMRFYNLSFGMHIIFRILILILFFSGLYV